MNVLEELGIFEPGELERRWPTLELVALALELYQSIRANRQESSDQWIASSITRRLHDDGDSAPNFEHSNIQQFVEMLKIAIAEQDLGKLIRSELYTFKFIETFFEVVKRPHDGWFVKFRNQVYLTEKPKKRVPAILLSHKSRLDIVRKKRTFVDAIEKFSELVGQSPIKINRHCLGVFQSDVRGKRKFYTDLLIDEEIVPDDVRVKFAEGLEAELKDYLAIYAAELACFYFNKVLLELQNKSFDQIDAVAVQVLEDFKQKGSKILPGPSKAKRVAKPKKRTKGKSGKLPSKN